MKDNLSFIFALALLLLASLVFSEIQKGSIDAILHDQESHEFLGIEIWYFPNGKIAGVKF